MEKREDVVRGCFEWKSIGEKQELGDYDFSLSELQLYLIFYRRFNVYLFLLGSVIDHFFLFIILLLMSVIDDSSFIWHWVIQLPSSRLHSSEIAIY